MSLRPFLRGMSPIVVLTQIHQAKQEFPVSSCLDANTSPSSTRAMVVSLSNAVNHAIKLTKPSGVVVNWRSVGSGGRFHYVSLPSRQANYQSWLQIVNTRPSPVSATNTLHQLDVPPTFGPLTLQKGRPCVVATTGRRIGRSRRMPFRGHPATWPRQVQSVYSLPW